MTSMSTDEPQVRKIDGEQVVFYRGEGWRCGCPDWVARRECQHVVKAAAWSHSNELSRSAVARADVTK
jgi:hypothetical protein